MTADEHIALVKAYIALSNAHRVDLIERLFARSAVYRSSAVGEYLGREAIAGMMDAFFTDYPDVRWRCGNYLHEGSTVSFDFKLEATAASNGENIRRRGHERIEFDADGFIRLLQVDAD